MPNIYLLLYLLFFLIDIKMESAGIFMSKYLPTQKVLISKPHTHTADKPYHTISLAVCALKTAVELDVIAYLQAGADGLRVADGGAVGEGVAGSALPALFDGDLATIVPLTHMMGAMLV
jgi:hypothetical protein